MDLGEKLDLMDHLDPQGKEESQALQDQLDQQENPGHQVHLDQVVQEERVVCQELKLSLIHI